MRRPAKSILGDGFEKRWARIPLIVNADKRLSGTDVRVFGGIAHFVFEGTVCRKPYALIAEASGVTRQQVSKSVAKLLETGHIKAFESNMERCEQWFTVTSPLFGQKQGKETVVRSGPRGSKRMVSVGPEDVRSAASA